MDDLVIHSVDPGLTFLDQFGLKTAVPATRNRDWHLAILTFQALAGCAVAPVALIRGSILAIFLAKMRDQLAAEHPLHQPDLKLFH